ncbi:EAL and GGDEF domain-containing protein [Propionivibrio soli]|uniref:sensor domain-containing protein n=1 Tax=Propionivibrio soli TaxID=2976531 RepID=UPI0021E6E639|nr:EAL domain-containing protein [Propionivibrio soli]
MLSVETAARGEGAVGAAYRDLFGRLLSGVAYCRVIYEDGLPVDFVYLDANPAFLEQMGLADVVGRRASEAALDFSSSDHSLLGTFGRVARDGDPERFEHFASRLNSWFSVSVYSPAREHVVALFEVITERKQAEAASRASEQRLLRVIAGSNQGFWDWNLATNVFTVCGRFESMLGYRPGEMDLAPENWDHYVHPDDLVRARKSIANHLSGKSSVHEVEIRCRAKSGEWLWILSHGVIVERDADGRPTMMSGVHTDITEKKTTELALRQAATVFENTQEGVLISDAGGRILIVNRAFARLTGFESHEALGRTPAFLDSGRHDVDFRREVGRQIQANGCWQGELWCRRKNGEIFPQFTTINAVMDDGGCVCNYVAVFTDTSAIKASEANLEYIAHHDSLTRLPNRLLLFSRIEYLMRSPRESGQFAALLMVDLDRFKDVNDSYGHLTGDHLLQLVAERLKARLRSSDTLARLGGDEFAILLEDIERPDEAGRVAGEVLQALGEPWMLPNDAELRVAASIGIALYPGLAESAEELLQQADAAMYRAKLEGRGRFQYFSDDLTRDARARLELENRLRRAIEREELEIHFQPQADVRSGLTIGAEALVRWRTPQGAPIPPLQFIPTAEETGLILALGRWVLRETCRAGRAWLDRDRPRLTLAVNVSAVQLRRVDFAAEVLRIVAETGFPAELLELELTESSLMASHEVVTPQLQMLRENGVRVAIDDFGTGYSSLVYLKRFPLDALKIDRTFIEHVGLRKDDQEIVAAIVQLGHTLGFRVVAEGVETQEQLRYLKEKGCDVFQGFLCSPALPAKAFEELLWGRC